MKDRIREILTDTLNTCIIKGILSRFPALDFTVEIPANHKHGDYATNIAFKLAGSQKSAPADIAVKIANNLTDTHNIIEKVDVAGAGFINFFIKREAWLDTLKMVIKEKDDFAKKIMSANNRVLVEYVSANPTGPLHLGHGRGAAVGDTLCRILSFRGYQVMREFYINDAGRQAKLLGESIYSRWKQFSDLNYPFPEDGYHGEYIKNLSTIISRETDLSSLTKEEAINYCMEKGINMMLQEIKKDLEAFGCSFDSWYSERKLYQSGALKSALKEMESMGRIYEKEGALWIRTSEYGDDKDRVIRKMNGDFTYFASDISYHLEKWKRGFSRAINIWGADHHGYINRIRAVLKAFGIEQGWLSLMIIQLVKLWQGGKEIKMSKRTGHYVTLRELMEEVGKDAARFVFLTKSHDSPLDFDIDLVKKKDPENPVYYVQYAHARICSIFRKARSKGISSLIDKRVDLLKNIRLDEEMAIVKNLAEFPSLLDEICRSLEPHRLTYYLTELASLFHKYFNLGNTTPEYRVITDKRDLTCARLQLADATRIVLKTGMNLLGVSAPDRM